MKSVGLTLIALLFSLASFAIFPITGPSSMCVGNTISLTDATTGGTWSSTGATSIAYGGTVGTVVGSTVGTGTITYTVGSSYVIYVVTVNPYPDPVTGPSTVCVGSTITLTDAGAGTWASLATSYATVVSTTGVVTGITVGSVPIDYLLPTGCGIIDNITVGLPTAGWISGPAGVCVGSSVTMTDGSYGGVWSCSNANATVSTAGVVTGVSTGLDTVIYTVTMSCGTASTIHPIDITGTSGGTISGGSSVCVGSSITLTETETDGVWATSSYTTELGTTTGVVTGVAIGTSVISYVLPGCGGTVFATHLVTVVAAPSPITGPTTVCPTGTITLADATGGGTWASLSTGLATVVSTSGVVTGVAAGTVSIDYSISSGCSVLYGITVGPPVVSLISGLSGVCLGSTTTLADATGGGTWSCSNAHATISSGGVVTAVSTGLDTVSYTVISSCGTVVRTLVMSVNGTSAGTITGSSTMCSSATDTLVDGSSGGSWTSSGVASVGSNTGVVYGGGAGTAIITYSIVGCGGTSYTTFAITVAAATRTAATAVVASCGGIYTLTASGATTYSWTPTTALSCPACATTTADPLASTYYTVTGSTTGCPSSTAYVSVAENSISGHISLTATSADTLLVWLVQFNPTDSSIMALDSMEACNDGGIPYYNFTGATAGNYLVKAKVMHSVAGTSGYIPTYGLSNAHWDTATTITHVASRDTMHINMIYGTVPPGPGFISGYVVSGAGRGTSGEIPAPNMLVYLEDAGGHILTYTYTDAAGSYSFGSLENGNYIVYPEAYKYYTTSSGIINLNPSAESLTGINFKQHTTLGTITPFSALGTGNVSFAAGLSVYPNPTTNGDLNIKWNNQVPGMATIVVTDLLGRQVYKSAVNITGQPGNAQLHLPAMSQGVYLITVQSAGVYYSGKLVVE